MEDNLEQKKKEFQQKREELSSLRRELASSIPEKEAAFQQLAALRQKIRTSLTQINALKTARDGLTKEVKAFKEERAKAQSALKEKATAQTEITQQRERLSPTVDIRERPGKVKSQIEFLERKIETEPMPFSKEKEITKKIKELKVLYAKLKQFQELNRGAHSVSAEVYESRKKADGFHQQVQETAKSAQEKHEQMNALYEELRALRAQEKNLAQNASQLKAQIEQSRQKIDALQKTVKELAGFFVQKEEKSFQQKVEEKTAEVKEKMKKGKKLSMDDILAFQASRE